MSDLADPGAPAPNILIAFYSRSGTTEALAAAVAEGAREAGASVRLRRARELVSPEIIARAPGWAEQAAGMNARYPAPTEDDAEWADGIVFGTPTRFGSMASELKAYIDSLGGLWFQGKLNGKAGAAFGTSANRHGGNEATLLALYNPMAHLGLVIVPLSYSDQALFAAGSPYGATAVTGAQSTPPNELDLAVARYQGRRVTLVAQALKAAGLTVAGPG